MAASAPRRSRRLQERAVADAFTTNTSTGGASRLEQFAFNDASDAVCKLGHNCTGGDTIPEARGVCVLPKTAVGANNECWDVCHPAHKPDDFMIGEDAAVNSGIAGLVVQVRAGMNSFVHCPVALKQDDTCPPGEMCSHQMLATYKISKNLGMCVVDESQPNSRACWDMCDPRRKPVDYILGANSRAEKHILELRQSGACPTNSWWPWVLAILLSLCLLGCCGYIIMVALRLGRKRTRSMSRGVSRLDMQGVCEDEDGADEPLPSHWQEMSSQQQQQQQYDDRIYDRNYGPPADDDYSACEYGSHDLQRRDLMVNPMGTDGHDYGQSEEPPLLLDERDLPPPPPQEGVFEDRYGAPPPTVRPIPGLDAPNLLLGMPPLAPQPEQSSSFSQQQLQQQQQQQQQQQPLLPSPVQMPPFGPAHTQPAFPFHFTGGTPPASTGTQPLAASFNAAIPQLPSSFGRINQAPLGAAPAMNSFGRNSSMMMQGAPQPPLFMTPPRL